MTGWLRPVALGAVLLPLSLAGCAAGVEEQRVATRIIRDAEPQEVLLAAQSILRREFGRLEVFPERYEIRTAPLEYRTEGASGTTRDLYGGASTMRRSATLSMARGEGGSIVRLRVDVERRDTDRREWVRHDAQRLSDSPAYTPIERDSATTERQNTVWTLVRRDVMRERDLLSELQEYFERRSEPEPVEASDD